jgi:hypothetical protein
MGPGLVVDPGANLHETEKTSVSSVPISFRSNGDAPVEVTCTRRNSFWSSLGSLRGRDMTRGRSDPMVEMIEMTFLKLQKRFQDSHL